MSAPRTPSRAAVLASGLLLLGLHAANVGLSFVALGAWGPLVTWSLTGAMVGLIVLVLMHVAWGTPLLRLFAAAGLVWLLILASLTLSDVLTRARSAPDLTPRSAAEVTPARRK